MNARVLAALLLVVATTSRAACPTQGGPWPASFSYDVTEGAHVASASASIPFPVDVVAPVAAAVQSNPTWPDAGSPSSAPASLRPMLEDEHFKESALDLAATADAECPGATRVTATFRWRFGPMARLFGGEAKDVPALVVLATRDEVLARLLAPSASPEASARTVPADLDLADDRAPALLARLEELAATHDVEAADMFAVLFDVHRAATAITGFRRMEAGSTDSKPEVITTSGARDIGYYLKLTKAEDGASLSFGFSMPQPQ